MPARETQTTRLKSADVPQVLLWTPGQEVLFLYLFFNSCVHIGEVALTHHTECPHLFPQSQEVILKKRENQEIFMSCTQASLQF